jgi:sucrose-6-phosphate hydrolase SacC (GH32 family)
MISSSGGSGIATYVLVDLAKPADIRPPITPSESYDEGGVFTGCMHVGESGDMTIVYTSARYLPIHWTKAHKQGSESVSLITSSDNGKTCEQCPTSYHR